MHRVKGAMNAITHALTMNGRIHGELKDPHDSVEALIEKRLTLLDGVQRYSLSLWQLPDGVPFDRVNLSRWPQEYIQAAGGRDRMTVEVRRHEDVGYRQYVIGRSSAGDVMSPTMTSIIWDEVETPVLSTEVFTAAEAAGLFIAYYSTTRIPSAYVLRRLE